MDSKIKVTLIQSYLFWEDTKKNLLQFESKINSINQKTDLVVLPETFNTGFSFNNLEKTAETMQGQTLSWMKKMAVKLDCVITGSILIKEKNQYFNRLLWVKPGGTVEYYNKRHLFILNEEVNLLTPGNEKVFFTLKGWKIRPIICFDLRFPVWCRNQEEYDLLLCVANWPEVRSSHWRSLMLARAVENQCFVIGVNRVGEDGKNQYHSGDSMLVHPGGNILFQKMDEEDVYTATINRDEITKARKNFPFMDGKDEFTLNL